MGKRSADPACAPDTAGWGAGYPSPPFADSSSAGTGLQQASCMSAEYWEENPGKFLGGFAGTATTSSLEATKDLRVRMGAHCMGVTCASSASGCAPRKGDPFLAPSPAGEVSY